MNFDIYPLFLLSSVLCISVVKLNNKMEIFMGIKISGIDKLQKQVKEAEDAAETLSGDYNVRFDANDPVSIENSIQEACDMLDERASRYLNNPFVTSMIESMKDNLRQQILDSAEQQRQERGNDGD